MTIIDVREPDVPAALGARPTALDDRALFGQPRGLGLLFVTEMWERFSYYGMRAILVLYLVNALKWDTPHATNLYGTYMMLVYLTPVIGGFLADRLIGTRRSLVIGSIVISLGHFTMAFPGMTTFYAGLGLIIIGTGFFKSNVSTMVGQIYREGDPRRDAGFTVFYVGINTWRVPRSPLLRMVRSESPLWLALGLRVRRRRHGARTRHLPLGPRQVSAGHRHVAHAKRPVAHRSGRRPARSRTPLSTPRSASSSAPRSRGSSATAARSVF